MKQFGGKGDSAIAGKSKGRPEMPRKGRIESTGARKKEHMTRAGRSPEVFIEKLT